MKTIIRQTAIFSFVILLIVSGRSTSFAMYTSAGSPTAIELLDFSATQSGRNIILEWATIMENNNDYFTIETSTDGQTWKQIKDIDGAGNSFRLNKYTCTITAIATGIQYYRLRQTSLSGSTTYPATTAVNVIAGSEPEVKVFPNPAEGIFYVNIRNLPNAEGDVFVYDMLGNRIFSSHLTDAQGKSVTREFDLSGYSGGYYFIEVISEGFTRQIKIVKN